MIESKLFINELNCQTDVETDFTITNVILADSTNGKNFKIFEDIKLLAF